MWQELELGDVVTLQRGFDLTEDQRQPGTIPVVTSSGISGTHNQARVKAPGVVTGRYGTLGEVYFLREDFWAHNTTLFAKDFHGNDERFVYYLLKSLNFANQNAASSVPGVNRNTLHRIRVRVPDVNIQRRIASILGALDDKIECNRRINQTLEQMAQALYKHWFVDFAPFRDEGMVETELGEVPNGWRVKSLDEIANFLNGLALQKYPANGNESLPVIKIAEMHRGVTDSSDRASVDIPSQYIIDDGDVLFSWSGSLELMIWSGGKGALNQHLFKVTSANYPKWFYYLWVQKHLPQFRAIAASKATTMGHIQREHLHQARVIVPPSETLEKMAQSMQPIFDQLASNNFESRSLARTRDYLLPKLMSGEIEIMDAEKVRESD